MRALGGLKGATRGHRDVTGGLRRAWARYRARRRGLRELRRVERVWRADGDDARALESLSRTLRRTAVVIAHDRPVGGLTGEAWLAFLDRTGGTDEFTRGEGRAMTSAPYQDADELAWRAIDVAGLIALTRRWVRHAKVPR